MYRLCTLLLVTTLGLGCWIPNCAEGMVIGQLEYVIRHKQLGDVGTHLVTITASDDGYIIAVDNEIAAKYLFWTHHEVSHQTEVWRNGRLTEYRRSSTQRGGEEKVSVLAHAIGDKLVVNGPAGRVAAPGNILSSHPWNPAILTQRRLMSTEDGTLKSVHVVPAGEEELTAGGVRVLARKYVMTGDLSRELWYDEHGLCLQVRLSKSGTTVTVTLNRASEPELLGNLQSALKLLGSATDQTISR
jgi:hypothetical protein